MSDQTEIVEIEWSEGRVPIARRFDDPYFSLTDGRNETRFVYLSGNQLPARFRPDFHIAELGFGTGLNLFCAWEAWNASGKAGPLKYTSFEAYPLAAEDIRRAMSNWATLRPMVEQVLDNWSDEKFHLETDTLDLKVIIGDARETVPAWHGNADAWFLDGFSPAKNPEMWEPDLLRAVAKHTNSGGTFATFTAASAVREALGLAGFDVMRTKGFDRKKHMTVGRYP